MRSLVVFLLVSASQQVLATSTLITNINGYSLNAQRELVRFVALQFNQDVVVAVFGTGDSLPRGITQVIDGGGKTLLPGLIDSHGHILYYGLNLLQVDLRNTHSEQDAVQRVRRFRTENPEPPWIQGFGWNQENWPETRYPSAASLDQHFDSTPIWLTRIDGHAGWANSVALGFAGIDADTADPIGGHIRRDADGNPTGILVDKAMDLVTRHIPETSGRELKAAIRVATLELARLGLTSVHDAGIGLYGGGMVPAAVYKELAEAGALAIRINGMIHHLSPELQDLLSAGPYVSDNQLLKINSVKIFADGALGSSGAALIDDYSDSPGKRGFLLETRQQLAHTIAEVMNAGFQTNTHAIGDLANRTVLDIYQQLIANSDTRHLRHRIEHASFVSAEDLPRFAKLGVIASIQPMFVPSDDDMVMARLGQRRATHTYAWRKLLDTGAIISAGSDFPVEVPNPFFGIHAAVNRTDMDNQPPGGWFPDQKLSVEEAFAAYTLDAAYAGHQEGQLGTLEPGKKADFILIDRDIFTVPTTDIGGTRVLQTWVGGRSTHQPEASPN